MSFGTTPNILALLGLMGLSTGDIVFSASPTSLNSNPNLTWDNTNNTFLVKAMAGQTANIYVYTGGTGTATIEYSNVDISAAFEPVTTSTQTLSGTGKAFFDVIKTGAAFARLKFSSATGTTGTLYTNKR